MNVAGIGVPGGADGMATITAQGKPPQSMREKETDCHTAQRRYDKASDPQGGS